MVLPHRRSEEQVLRGEGAGGLGRQGEGTRKHRLAVTEQSQDARCSLGNGVNAVIVVTTCGARWGPEVSGVHFLKYLIA